jgi:hypothetical protein
MTTPLDLSRAEIFGRHAGLFTFPGVAHGRNSNFSFLRHSCGMKSALWLMLLATSVASSTLAASSCDPAARQLLSQAIDAAGGQAALSAAPVLAWTGDARIYSDQKIISITVDTVVEPPVRARSRSWLTEKGPATERVMEIGPSQGSLTRGGVTSPMPQSMLRHERQQYAIYELLRLTPLQQPQCKLTMLRKGSDGLRGFRVRRPGLPGADLWFDDQAHLAVVKTIVSDPDSGKSIREEVRFSGQIEDQGVRWPKLIQITWNGVPYFDLTLNSFSARQKFDQ